MQESVYAETHQKLGDGYIRSDHRLVADSTAYALMQKNGMDTSSFDFGYIKDISGVDKLIAETKVSVSKAVKLSEKSLDKLKTKEKSSALGKLHKYKEKIKTPDIKLPKKEITR